MTQVVAVFFSKLTVGDLLEAGISEKKSDKKKHHRFSGSDWRMAVY